MIKGQNVSVLIFGTTLFENLIWSNEATVAERSSTLVFVTPLHALGNCTPSIFLNHISDTCFRAKVV